VLVTANWKNVLLRQNFFSLKILDNLPNRKDKLKNIENPTTPAKDYHW
jgi:hypothetical protein